MTLPLAFLNRQGPSTPRCHIKTQKNMIRFRTLDDFLIMDLMILA